MISTRDGAFRLRTHQPGRSTAIHSLLAGVSLFALAVAAAPVQAAERPFTLGWYQQRAQARTDAAGTPARSGAVRLSTTQQAQVDRSLASMTRATEAVRAQLAAQATARATASLQPNPAGVADGLRPGGLVPYPGATTDSAVRGQGLVWDGADLPTEQQSGADVTVSVRQTENKAILTWQTFNVGRNTTLDFNQHTSDGTPQRDWVALNRVVARPPDANGRRQVASPSQILGRIRADGEVYIINQNGIIFGGASQVNVRSLIASTLDVGRSNMRLTERNAYFRNPPAGQMSFSFQYLYVVRADGNLEGIEKQKYDRAIITTDGNTAPTGGFVFDADAVEGAVDVEAGAVMQINRVGSDGALGRIALIAPQVVNRGQIDTPDGQTLLVGARNATMFNNDANVLGTFRIDPDPNLRGARVLAGSLDPVGVRTPLIPESTVNNGFVTPPFTDDFQAVYTSLNLSTSAQAYAGSVVNTGIVTANRGNITVTGSQLTHAGVLAATTSVNANGSIYLRAYDAPYAIVSDDPSNPGGSYIGTRSATPGFVRLTDGSVISILADTQVQADGTVQTIPAGSTTSFKSSVVDISLANGVSSYLPGVTFPGDVYPVFSTLNFPSSQTATVAGQIDVGSGSLVKAPGAQLSLNATTQELTTAERLDPSNTSVRATVLVRDGAVIDVSGLMAVPVGMEDNLVTIPIVTANDLADSPLQRNGVLRNRSGLVVDRRATGLRSDGSRWYGTPLFDANGYISAQGLPVEQLLVNGGAVTINGTTVLQSGSLISVAGGYRQYSGGFIQTTSLVSADGGHVFDISRADPNYSYSGIAGRHIERHDRWGQTRTFDGLALVNARRRYEPGYVEGGNGGSLTGSGPLIIEGRIDGGAIQGPYQRAGGPFASVASRGATLDFTQTPVNALLFQPTQLLRLGSGPLATDAFPLTTFLDQTWSADWIEESGASDLRFGNRTTYDGASPIGVATETVTVTADTDLHLLPGGKIVISGRSIDVAGRVSAPSGSITFNLSLYPDPSQGGSGQQRSTFTLQPGAVLDVSGLWVNDRGATMATFVGSDYVNGGSVTVQSTAIEPSRFQATQFPIPGVSSVIFEAGSAVNLSSGGYVASNGQVQRDSNGVAIGKGGDLSILFHPGSQRPNIVPVDPNTLTLPPEQRMEKIDDALALKGTILANGFQGGGTFRLRAPVISINDGGSVGGTGGEFNLPASFFEQGFGNYDLTALLRARIEPGTQIRLRQQQLQPAPQAAFAFSRSDAATPGSSVGLQRAPVNFSLTALGFVDYTDVALPSTPPNSFSFLLRGRSFTSDNTLIVGVGSLIEGGPQASIALSSSGQLTFAGSIRAPGGTVSLTQRLGKTVSITTPGFQDILFGGTSLFVEPTAVIDVRGTTVIDPRQTFRAGNVLAGGKVSLTADNLITQAGSRIDTSGAAGVLDLTARKTAGTPLLPVRGSTPTTIVSDAGSIAFSLSNAAWSPDPTVVVGYNPGSIFVQPSNKDGLGLVETTMVAAPGGAGAVGGTLSLTGPAILFRTEGVKTSAGDSLAATLRPDTLTSPTATLPVAIPAGMLVFGTDRLAGSGIDSLCVSGSENNSTNAGVIGFGGDVRLSLGRRIVFSDVSVLTSVPAGSYNLSGTLAPTAGIAAKAVIEAPYLAIRGKQSIADYANPSVFRDSDGTIVFISGAGFTKPWLPGTLTFRGDTIDFGGTVLVQNAGMLSLESRGDLRFIPVNVPTTTIGSRILDLTAVMRSAGDIALTSAQTYPTTAVTAVIQSTLSDGTITFDGNGNPAPVPLSAAGRLYVSAAGIVQRGVVRAPLGGLVFGVSDETTLASLQVSNVGFVPGVAFQPTRRVELAAGSLTSTSAAGLTIPYGQTANLRDWTYAAASGAPLTAPPEKSITINAPSQTLSAGATVDMQGGGDIYAYEWVPGLGGSRNVLTTSTNGDSTAPVYAIVPTYTGSLAPVDAQGFGNISQAGDTSFNDVGRTLTIGDGVPGLPAGTYLLLPGSYATLPGAYRVQVANNAQDSLLDQPVALADGTRVIAGRLGYSTGARASRTRSFTIQSGSVWRQYSEINQPSGNTFFANLAAKKGTVPPRLPIDAGRLTLLLRPTTRLGTVDLNLGANLLFAAAAGGRGGQVDIASPVIQVVSTGQSVAAGGIVLTPEDIRSFNAESVLLGATRTSTADGDSLLVIAETIRVATTAADPLTNPELILAAHDEISIEPTSVIAARGAVSVNAAPDIVIAGGRRFRFGSGTIIDSTGGDGTVLRVSTGNLVQINREDVRDRSSTTAIDRITIGAGAVIDGGGALQLESSKDTLIDTAALLGGQHIDIAGSQISFLDALQPANSIGSAALGLLSNARTIAIRGGQSISFAQPMRIATAAGAPRLQRLTLDTPRLVGGNLGGGAVSVDATTVVLGNSYASDGSTLQPLAGPGVFQATADTLILTGNDRILSGFDRFEGASTLQTIFGQDKESGILTVPGSVSLVSPLVTLGGGSRQTLQATGALSLTGAGSALAVAAGGAGGRLALDAASVTLDTVLAARAGIVEMRARSGDVVFGSGATLFAGGYTQQFLDTIVILAGGRVTLQADSGSVILQPGSRLDVASDPGGNGGELNVVIGNAASRFSLAPGVLALVADQAGQGGGSFALDTRGRVDLGSLVADLIEGRFTGGVRVASGAGDLLLTQNLTARDVRLVADGGRVTVGAVIDASGSSGGRIELFGADGVTLQAGTQLLARATTDAGRGGQVTIGSRGNGLLDLAGGSLIDVAGGSDYGASGGTVRFRVPFVDAGEQAIGAHLFGASVANATAVILDPYQRLDLGTAAFNNGVIDTTARWEAIFAAFTPATTFGATTQGLQQALGDRFFVMPGLELFNGNPVVNNGDIRITASVDLVDRRYDGFPGILTVRAAGDLRIDASISDGFRGVTAADNTTASANLLSCANPGTCLTSWSYNLAAGARTGSADPLSVEQAAAFEIGALASRGNFIFGARPTMGATTPLGANDIIRTGTGWIDVVAGGEGLSDRVADAEFALTANAREAGFRVDEDAAILFMSPTAVLYTAGVNIEAEPGFNTTIDDLASLPYSAITGLNTVPSRVGLIANRPAFATRGGDIRLEAPHGNIVAQQNYHDIRLRDGSNRAALTGQGGFVNPYRVYAGQLFTPWLLGQGVGSLDRSETGVFGGDGVQSARWVLTGAFQQGITAFGGGDVSLSAGGDVDNISVSIVSTYRAVGGRTASDPPRLVTYGGGNLSIDAGGRVGSIVTLVDEGSARIRAGESIAASYHLPIAATGTPTTTTITQTAAVGPMFFIGDASLELEARGTIEIGAVAQPEIYNQLTNALRPFALDRPANAIASAQTARVATSLSYGEDRVLQIISASGDIQFRKTNVDFVSRYGGQNLPNGASYMPDPSFGIQYDSYLPPTVQLAAAQGNVTIQDGLYLAPAASGNLQVLAYGSIHIYSRVSGQGPLDVRSAGTSSIKLFDVDPQNMAGPLNPLAREILPFGAVVDDQATPINWRNFRGGTGYALDSEDASATGSAVFNTYYVHANPILHRNDPEPMRIVALTGDIISGNNPGDPGDPTNASYRYGVQGLYVDKSATIYAGRDILNLIYVGFNASVDDITSIIAGRDITYEIGFVGSDPVTQVIFNEPRGSTYFVGGPGQFFLEAGRDLFLKPSEPAGGPRLTTTSFGVQAVGNRINPYLPSQSADLNLLFGVGPGTDQQAFIGRYIDPTNAGSVPKNYLPELTTYMQDRLTREARERDPLATVTITLTPEAAFDLYAQLSPAEQLPFVQRLLFAEVRVIADQLNNPDQYQNYPRAYRAIETLFPGRLGYTDNLASSPTRVATGDFDMLDAVVRTEFGSSITILGPGGRATLGGLNSQATLPANVQGVFTLRGGAINAYVDGNFDVFNSRVLTLQGGDITIMSGNGNVDAGRGRNTERVFPPLVTQCNPQTTGCAIDFGGLVSGAGIGTIAAVPGVPPGDVFLLAPRGVIDAGAAGIRATGNLFTVAPTVLNAENIQTGGKSFGVTQTSGPPVAALAAAAGAADKASAANEAVAAAAAAQARPQRVPTLYTMELVGFGGWDGPQ